MEWSEREQLLQRLQRLESHWSGQGTKSIRKALSLYRCAIQARLWRLRIQTTGLSSEQREFLGDWLPQQQTCRRSDSNGNGL